MDKIFFHSNNIVDKIKYILNFFTFFFCFFQDSPNFLDNPTLSQAMSEVDYLIIGAGASGIACAWKVVYKLDNFYNH